jgi:putative ABC transport system ATP-binding protein
MTMTEILKVENISKKYDNGGEVIKALDKVSIELRRGEILAIMGSSGSGKSTLLHILGALDQPDEGIIYLNHVHEKNYSKEPYATKIRSEYIGFVFQQFNLLNDLNVEENISLPLLLAGVSEQTIKKRVAEKISIVGLEGREHHRPFELSGGQQQRAAIARAIVTSPKILLADEPTGNLDYNTATHIMKLFKKMNEELNQSIIIVTHDPMVASYAHRILFFHEGMVKNQYCNKGDRDDIDQILKIFRNIALE